MKYRSFPRIPDLPISVLGFGCMRLPVLDGAADRIDENAARPLLRQAIDAGVNYVDTAYAYHGGQSEVFVGRALRDGYREKVRLATKSPVWLVQQESDWERLLDEQLKRLDTDHVDFYLLHALSAARWELIQRHRGLPAMERALKDGRIRHLGFSFHDALPVLKTIVDGYDWDFCQIQLNFVDQGFQAGVEGLRYAADRRIGAVVMEPLRGGALASAQPGEVQAIWARSGIRRSPAEWALAWVWDHPEVVTLLSGMNTADQVWENLGCAQLAQANAMPPAERALVEEVGRWYGSRMQVPCTTCGYCAPCPQGVSVPDVFASYNTGGMFGTWEGAAFGYKAFVMGQGKGAERCIACGECVPKCPQGIAIPERLKEAHEALTTGRP